MLSDINLEINNGEYVTIVGPTGAGKTELIALISGLYRPDHGQIFFDSKDVTRLPPEERHCGFMFESYALFPHLNILDNVSYARHMQEPNHQETYEIARELLGLVRIIGRDIALPKECSGGMQQRVALARALMAMEYSGLLILDEPFKALDAGLRMNLRQELRKIAKSKDLRLTTIHITNDMQEAMMGDRIVVMNQGTIRQIGTPAEIMYNPSDLFVANFFSSELNYFSGKILRIGADTVGKYRKVYLHKIIIRSDPEGYIFYAKTNKTFNVGDEVTFLIRSQYFKARHKQRMDKTNNVIGKVKRVKFMGAWLRIELATPYQYGKLENIPENLVNVGMSIEDEGTEMQSSTNAPMKIIKMEIPTTRVAIHNFTEGQTLTAYFPSEFVIVFPKIEPQMLENSLKVR